MELETRIHISRKDAEINPVILVEDKYEFETEEEQLTFTEELLAWVDERPIPNGGHLARNRYKGDHKLIETLDKCHGPASIWQDVASDGMPTADLDVPSFLRSENGEAS